jgi:thiamine-phosphate pyrophosphorylase
MLNGLYALTDSVLTPDETLLEQVEMAIKGGLKILQFREKQRPDEELLSIVKALKKLCKAHQVTFIINDRLELAQKVDADGLHIGQHDLSFTIASKEFPNKILGVSCYGDLDRAAYFQDQGANYVAFGAFFPSPTKPLAIQIPDTLLKSAKKRLSIPICAIGGITLENAAILCQHNVDMLAVISDLWKNPDIMQRAQALSNLL